MAISGGYACKLYHSQKKMRYSCSQTVLVTALCDNDAIYCALNQSSASGGNGPGGTYPSSVCCCGRFVVRVLPVVVPDVTPLDAVDRLFMFGVDGVCEPDLDDDSSSSPMNGLLIFNSCKSASTRNRTCLSLSSSMYGSRVSVTVPVPSQF